MKHFKNLSVIRFLIPVFILGLITSCGSDDPEKQAEKDREKILEYIEEHDLDAQELESGVFYVIEEEGSGSFPTETSTVIINYTGFLLDGDEFGAGTASTFNLNSTILGFKYGIPMFNRGSKGILLIPSGLAYGEYGSYTIPPNAVLIYNIEMIDFL
ncbi:MAG: FKBP-type peptidyl-prolyl cis-trans isomerase [Bacteroides sp.]|jgi:FKBP-type peptidyl-prolyl cis-trans isomerase|nr:FKBP-type peptidyl-prolyl cis-trans isomerase [Bacteroides sp.]